MAVDQTGLEGKNVTRFSYKHAKTLARFAASDAFIRGVMGPFGPTSCDTEYLTPKGWKRIDEYLDGDELAEFDLKTSQIIFRKPSRYIKTPCNSFLHLKNRYGIDQLLSDEHTVLYNTRYKPNEWRTILAGELSEQHNKLSGGWSGRIPTTFKAPETTGLKIDEHELRLQVAISADGHFPKNSDSCKICVRKKRKKDRLRWLLTICEIEWIERNYPQRPTETTFIFQAIDKNKLLWEYFEADEKQLAIIVDEFVYWDGCTDSYGGRIYSSTIKENADFIQYALATTGVRATISEVEYKNKNWKTGYRVYANTGTTFLSLGGAPPIERVPSPDGYKYCFTTGTGFFVARRNGKIFITGNSGKSTACLFEIIRRAQAQRPAQDGIRRTRWAVIRNTFPQLIDTTIKTVKDWLPFETWGRYHAQRHDYTITGIEGCEIELMFRALDRPDHLRNLLGIEFTGAWINEGREVPRAILDGITGRVGRYPKVIDGGCSWFGIIMDTNPPDDESWWFKMFEEMEFPEDIEMFCPGCGIKFDVGINKGECPECKLKYLEIFKQPSGVSPLAENIPYLPPNYYTNMMIGKESDWIQVYVKGMYGVVQEGKPVYPMYNDRIHCSPVKFNPKFPVYRGFDFGLTPACIMAQMPPTGQLKVGYELCADRAGADRFSDEVLKYCAINMPGDKWEYIDIGDPAGNTASQTDEKTCFQILRGKGIKIQPGHQGLEMRLESVRYPLHTMIDGNPGIIIDPRCKRLRKGFLGRYQYRRKITSREEYHEVPDKNDYSHIHDGLQYICSALFSNVLKGRVAKLSRQVERDSWPEREGIKNKTNKYTGY